MIPIQPIVATCARLCSLLGIKAGPCPPGPFGVGLRQFDGSAWDERKSGIKSWRHCRSFRQAHLPAHSPAGERFGGQPPAVRAALRPEMCGQFQGVPGLPEMGSKTERKRNSAVVIPQRLRSQEKSRGHPQGVFSFLCRYGRAPPWEGEPCVAISKKKAEDLKAYLDAAERRNALTMFYLELVSGIRKGELVALQ